MGEKKEPKIGDVDFSWNVITPGSRYNSPNTIIDSSGYVFGIDRVDPPKVNVTQANYDSRKISRDVVDEFYAEHVKSMRASWNNSKPIGDKIPKSIKPRRRLSMDQKMRNAEVRYNLKEEYTLQECLDAFDNLCKKDIGDIYLTGSVALYLQSKITRTMFKDLDIVCVGEYMLDDDIYDNPYGCKYPPDPSGVERTPVAFNDVKIDIFSNINYINSVNVEYLGKTYLCQDYKDIIKAKLRMVLPKVKDLDELLETSFEITYK